MVYWSGDYGDCSSEDRAKALQRFGGGLSVLGSSDGRGGTWSRCLTAATAMPDHELPLAGPEG